MTLTLKQKYLTGTGILLLILIITNPSAQAFKEYIGSSTYEGLHKQTNLFVVSIYKERGTEYIGVLGNFFKVEKELPKQHTYYSPALPEVDSTRKDTTKQIIGKLTITQFAIKIKNKYPEYRNIENRTLVEKILIKYPIYKETVDLQPN